MHNITLISTVHKEMGKCNADELCKIIEKLNPEVVFLEARDDTYSNYEKQLFKLSNVYHKQLEIRAIQKYLKYNSIAYVPVLDIPLSDAFDKKYVQVCENGELQKLIDEFNYLATEYGFEFINSFEAQKRNEEMRMLENIILNGTDVSKAFYEYNESYENSMIRNISLYCNKNQFVNGIFMCGIAHRKSIIEKIETYNAQGEIAINLSIYEDSIN